MRALRDLLLSHTNRVIQNSLLLLFALNALPPGASTPLICTKATVIGREKNSRSDTSATIGKLVNNVLINPYGLSFHVIHTQMSVMPEASSALFMSQFTDEAVRDAIARVSCYSVHVAPTTALRFLCDGSGWKHDIYKSSRYVCSDDVVCLGLREGSEELFFLQHNLQFSISPPITSTSKALKLEIFIALISRLAVFFFDSHPRHCHMPFNFRYAILKPCGRKDGYMSCQLKWNYNNPLHCRTRWIFCFSRRLLSTSLTDIPKMKRNFVTRKGKNVPQQHLWSINSCYSASWQWAS